MTHSIYHPALEKICDKLRDSFIDADNLIEDSEDIQDASVLFAITNEKEPKVLLTRRASHMNSHAGEVSFPGGKYEAGDMSNVETAIRETVEETSIDNRIINIVGQLPVQTSKSGLSVRPIVAVISPNPTLVAEEGEIARIFWVKLDWLIQEKTTDYQVDYKMGDEVMSLLTPSWQTDGEVIWGLTGRIIASLLKVVFNKQVDWYYKPSS